MAEPHTQSKPNCPHQASQSAKKHQYIGLSILLMFFGGLSLWSFTIPLTSSVTTSGLLSPEGQKRTIQHLEGGKIDSVLVEEGDRVDEGQPLAILHDDQQRARQTMLEAQKHTLLIRQARMVAERAGVDTFQPPSETQDALYKSSKLQGILKQQQALMETRNLSHFGQREIYQNRIDQFKIRIDSSKEQISALGTQMALLNEEISSVNNLVNKGLERRPRLLSLQRLQASLTQRVAEQKGIIAALNQQIGETKLKVLNFDLARREDLDFQISEVETELAILAERLASNRDVLERRIVRAPISGIVHNLQVSRDGGVLRAGGALLDIHPKEEILIVEAKLPANQIEQIFHGMPTRITLTGMPQRNQFPLVGHVKHIAPDALTDSDSNKSYYALQIAIDGGMLEHSDDYEEMLTPGMPAQIHFEGQERYLSDYLIEPLIDSFHNAFQEN